VKLYVDRFERYLARPMYLKARIPMALLVIPLIAAIFLPLWQIRMTAPQYPEGLYIDIYAYKLVGGNEGQHIREINTLNHYIGMHPIDEAAAADLDWIPFALGAMVLMALRVAAAGSIKDLMDLVVVTGYVALFAFGRFVYRLWVFGHTLAADAPVRIKGFMPVVFGHRTVANFETYSYPQAGAYLLGVFVLGTTGILLWHLVTGRRKVVEELEGPSAAV
jgi:hypothetical protein